MGQATLVQKMKEKAEAVQTRVALVRSMEEALTAAVEITLKGGGHVLAAPGLGERHEEAVPFLNELCRSRGVDLLMENLRGHMGRIHTAFTVGDYAIAETGTLVQISHDEDLRMATMLSETHVAVIPVSRIRPHALAFEPEMLRILQRPPSYLAFISGASRTADIERLLTIGVHGPSELHMLILEEEPHEEAPS